MATALATAFREQVKATKDISMISEMNYSVSYPTGYLNLDFANGYIQEVNGKRRYELGLSDGSINMLIGASSTGKTSLLVSIVCNIIRRYKTSCVFFEQAEVGTNIQRIKNLSGFTTDEEFTKKFIIRDAGISIESIYDRVKMINDIKTKNPENYMYNTGMIDMFGKEIYKFEPTFFIVDSVKMIASNRAIAKDEMDNMSGANNARDLSFYSVKLTPICRQSNIIMIFVNHITTDINTGYTPKKAELPFLRQGEHLPGGKTFTYSMSNIFRLDIRTKLKPEEGFGISGSIVDIDIVKSRTNKSGRSNCSLVFDQATGFDSELSLFLLLKENKLLEGGGAFLKIPGCDIKFSQKQFKPYIRKYPELYNAFVQVCYKFLTETLNTEYERIQEESTLKTSYKTAYDTIIEMLDNAN